MSLLADRAAEAAPSPVTEGPEHETKAEGGPTVEVLSYSGEQDMRNYLRRCLEIEGGIQVLLAHTPDRALRIALDRRPKLLIADATSSRRGVLRLCRAIQERLGRGGVPVLLLSDELTREEARELERSCGGDVLEGPINARRLCEAVRRCLEANAEDQPERDPHV